MQIKAMMPASQPAQPARQPTSLVSLKTENASLSGQYTNLCVLNTKYFKFEELKNSIFLSNFSEDDIKYWIKNTTEFIEDDEGTVYYMD